MQSWYIHRIITLSSLIHTFIPSVSIQSISHTLQSLSSHTLQGMFLSLVSHLPSFVSSSLISSSLISSSLISSSLISSSHLPKRAAPRRRVLLLHHPLHAVRNRVSPCAFAFVVGADPLASYRVGRRVVEHRVGDLTAVNALHRKL